MLAEGRTTWQTATAPFLSPKPVAYDLRNVCTKLDIHSRDALAGLLGGAGSGEAAMAQ